MAPPVTSSPDHTESDDALVIRFASGDQAAARELATRHTGRILALANRMLKNTAEAEDVTQETMLRLWRNASEWRSGEAKLSTWLHRVALNLCYDRLRKRRDAPLDDAQEPEDDRISAHGTMERDESALILQQAIDALPDRQRAAIQMRHFEERGNEETAELLGISVEAVESLLARGRRTLKEKLAAKRAVLL